MKTTEVIVMESDLTMGHCVDRNNSEKLQRITDSSWIPFFEHVSSEQRDFFENFLDNHLFKGIQIDGKQFEYISCGKGSKTILLLHGAMVSAHMWFYVIKRLEKDYRIIAPTLPKEGLGANQANRLINKIFEEEKVEKAIIVGYSYGGAIAQYFTQTYPEKVELLVLSHTGLMRGEESISATKKMLKVIRILPSGFLSLIQFLRLRGNVESEWREFRKAFFKWMFSTIQKKDFINLLEESNQFCQDVADSEKTRIPWDGSTVLLGTNSDKDTFKYFDVLSQLYPSSTEYVFDLPGGHHTIFLHPVEYTSKLQELISNALTGTTNDNSNNSIS